MGFTSDGNLCRMMSNVCGMTPTEVRTIHGWNRLLISFAWLHLTPDALEAWADLELFAEDVPPVDMRPRARFGLDTLPDVVFIIDDDGVILDCRGGSPRDLVRPRSELVGKSIAGGPSREVAVGFRAAMKAARDGADPATVTYTLKNEEGCVRYEARLSRTRDGSFIAVVRNTNRIGLDAAAAHDKLSMLEATFDATADGILVVDSEGNYVTSNRIFHDMWRVPRHMLYQGQESAVARFVLRLLKKPEAALQKAVTIHNSVRTQTRDVIQFHDGRFVECVSMPKWIDGKKVGRVWSFRDITDRVRAEQRTRFNAYHDSLTRLPNRALFQDRLAQAIGRARRSQSLTALLLLDLDRFKTINDTLGHAAGDKLLVEVASRLVVDQLPINLPDAPRRQQMHIQTTRHGILVGMRGHGRHASERRATARRAQTADTD